MEDGLHSDELLERLKGITDKKEFADAVYDAVFQFRDQAVDPGVNGEPRLKALNMVLSIFVEHEEYEKCSFIRDLISEVNGE